MTRDTMTNASCNSLVPVGDIDSHAQLKKARQQIEGVEVDIIGNEDVALNIDDNEERRRK